MPIQLAYGDPYYYTEEYMTIVRSCKELILQRAVWVPFISDATKYGYRNNFHKLIRASAGDGPPVPEDMIWTIAFINGIENPAQNFMDLKGFWLVDKNVMGAFTQTTRVIRE